MIRLPSEFDGVRSALIEDFGADPMGSSTPERFISIILRRLSDSDDPIAVLRRLVDLGIDFSQPISQVAGVSQRECRKGFETLLRSPSDGRVTFPGSEFHVQNDDPLAAWPLAQLGRSRARQWANMLVKVGVDPNLRLAEGRTLLMVAAANNNLQACKALIRAGADPLARDDHGRDAFDHRLEDIRIRGSRTTGINKGAFADRLSKAWGVLGRGEAGPLPGQALWRHMFNRFTQVAQTHNLRSAINRMIALDYPDELAITFPGKACPTVLHGLLHRGMGDTYEAATSDAAGNLWVRLKNQLDGPAYAPHLLWRAALDAGADPMVKDAEGMTVLEKMGAMGLSSSRAYAMAEAAALDRRRPARQRREQAYEIGL